MKSVAIFIVSISLLALACSAATEKNSI